MPSDDNAEKARQGWYRRPENDGVDVSALSNAFMAAWHARDAEVTELRERIDEYSVDIQDAREIGGKALVEVESLRQQLAEAQATIGRVREHLTGPMPTTDAVMPWLREAVAILTATPSTVPADENPAALDGMFPGTREALDGLSIRKDGE